MVCLFCIYSAVCRPTGPILGREGHVGIQFYQTIIYHQFVWVRVREEPHWQGASPNKEEDIRGYIILEFERFIEESILDGS